MCRHAIVRPPGSNFAFGLTTANLGRPDYGLALNQHEQYCLALDRCGISVTMLDADDRFPDGTFVEDVAVIAGGRAILTHPGAPSREGETVQIQGPLRRFFPHLSDIQPPATLEGGDVCEAGADVFIGISERTNHEGSRQLSEFLGQAGYSVRIVDIRAIPGILHLKSGLAFLGENELLVWDVLANLRAFEGYELVRAAPGEEYAANCVLVNGILLFAKGFPVTEKKLRDLGYNLELLDVSEFQKMDGGLSCLSLRF